MAIWTRMAGFVLCLVLLCGCSQQSAATDDLIHALNDAHSAIASSLLAIELYDEQRSTRAVTETVLGDMATVTTFPRADRDGPPWTVTPQHGRLDYAEGTRVGYRGWYGSDVEPAFWFGAGLGWGVGDYRSAEQRRDGDSLRVVLANTGQRASREVV